MIKIRCSRKEKELIRKVINVQIDNLNQLVNREAPVDLTLFCIEQEIDATELEKSFIRNLMRFQKVKDDPNSLFQLDSDNLSIFRHILCHLKIKGYRRTRAKVWRKIFHQENLFKYQNLN